MAESSGTADSSTRDGRRRFSECLGIVAGLVVLYLAAHHIWMADEPGRVLWAGPVGVVLEWMWWAGIGAAVRGLTTTARSIYEPSETSHLTAWPSLLVVLSTALLVLILFALRVVVRLDVSATILAFDFGRPPGEILVLVAFGLGFFHRLAVVYLRLVACNSWEAVRRAAARVPGSWRDFWQGIRAMWQDRRIE